MTIAASCGLLPQKCGYRPLFMVYYHKLVAIDFAAIEPGTMELALTK